MKQILQTTARPVLWILRTLSKLGIFCSFWTILRQQSLLNDILDNILKQFNAISTSWILFSIAGNKPCNTYENDEERFWITRNYTPASEKISIQSGLVVRFLKKPDN